MPLLKLWLQRTLVALLCSLTALAIITVRIDVPWRWSATQIAAADVLVQPNPERDIRARDPLGLGQGMDLSQEFSLPAEAKRQYHFIVKPTDQSRQGIVVLVPAAGGDISAFANAVPVGDNVKVPMLGPGLGLFYTAVLIPAKAIPDEGATVDLVMTNDLTHAGVRSIALANGADFEGASEALNDWHEWLRGVAMVAAGLGGLCAGLGLVLARQRLAYGAGMAVVCGFGFWLIGPSLADAQTGLALQGGLAFVGIGGALGMLAGLRRTNVSGTVLAVCSLLSVVALVVGAILVWTRIDIPLPMVAVHVATLGHAPLALIAMPILLFVDGRSLLARMAALRAANAHQQQRLAEQERDLLAAISAHAVAQERQRFVRDIHDGIGGQLLSLLTRVRMGRATLPDIAHELQGGLSDLRLVADSLDSVGDDLEDALDQFHGRAQQQLDAAGIALSWQQPDSLPALGYGARDVLNLYRILQEALSNTVRHAKAERFSVLMEAASGGELLIEFGDNGQGFDADASTGGKGVANMTARATAIRAELSLEPKGVRAGTWYQLRLKPL